MVMPLRRRRALTQGLHEPHVVQAICRHLSAGMVACDVGSHLGYMSLVMARQVGPDGRVFAFEPEPRTRQRLCRTLARNDLPQVLVEAEAVAAAPGQGTLVIPANDAMGCLVDGPIEATVPAARVEVTSLDAWAARRQPPRVDLIKLDIEGGELEALEGARRLLRDQRPILLCEVHWGRGISYAPDELVAWLEEAGYCPRLLSRSGEQDRDLPKLLGRLSVQEPPQGMHGFHLLAVPETGPSGPYSE